MVQKFKDIFHYSSSLYAYRPCYSVVGDLMRSNLGWPPATLYTISYPALRLSQSTASRGPL
eukprot:scaffold17340_cov74-Skeletonema_dohrnii-CCMP3373.AAC.1